MTLEDSIRRSLHKGARTIRKRSGARTYAFYWHRKDQRLAVRVERDARDHAAEALAVKVQQAPRPCPVCRRSVPRVGKRRYCSDRCAARDRKMRFYRRRAQAVAEGRQATKEQTFVDAAIALAKTKRGIGRRDIGELAAAHARRRPQ
jgi:hypothetical protein